jgi:hypothetical protein
MNSPLRCFRLIRNSANQANAWDPTTAARSLRAITARVKFNYHPNNRLDAHKRMVDSIISICITN